MRILPLCGRTPGRFTLLDDPDYEWAVNESWLYRRGEVGAYGHRLHRVILERAGNDLTGQRVTHDNLWRLDNRQSNLRVTSRGCNRTTFKQRNIQRFTRRGYLIQTGQTKHGYAPTRKEAEDRWDEIVLQQSGILPPDEQQLRRDELVELLESLVADRVLSRHPGNSLDDKYRLVFSEIVALNSPSQT